MRLLRPCAVTYSCTADDKTVIPETQLTQNTDWNWSGMAKLPANCKGKRIFMTAKSVVQQRRGNRQPHLFPVPAGRKSQDSATGMASQRKCQSVLLFSVVAGGKVYVASLDEDLKGEGAVFALDAKTGDYNGSIRCATPSKHDCVDDGTVFAQDAEGYLYAIDAQTWQTEGTKR